MKIDKNDLKYRKIIQSIVGSDNIIKKNIHNSVIYYTLVDWLKENNIRLEKETFTGVLNACKNLLKDESLSVDEACSQSNVIFMQAFPMENIPYADKNEVEKYVNMFYSTFKAKIDEEKNMIDYNSRLRKFDVVEMGKLFDFILEHVKDENIKEVISKMDLFMSRA